MPIFKIFRARRLYRDIKENPGKVAADGAAGVVQGLVLVPVIIFGTVLALLFVLGFTKLFLGYGDFLIAQLLFSILLPVYLIVLLVTWLGVRKMRKKTESFTNETIQKTGL